MTQSHFGATAQAEIDKIKAANDALLDKIIHLVAERDLAQEKLSFMEHQFHECTKGWGLHL